MAKAKRRAAFTISVAGSTARSPLKISLNWPLMAVALLVGASIVYLAGLSIFNIITQPNANSGYDLALRGSSSTREFERENQIAQLKNQNTQLQQENQKYKQDIADLDTRVKQLADSIETLKAFAKQLQDRLGVSGPEPPAIPTPSGSTGGNNTTAYLFGDKSGFSVSGAAPGSSDASTSYTAYVADATYYYQQYDKVLSQLQNVNQTLVIKKQNIADLGKQIQNYQNQLNQTVSTFSIDAQRAIDKDVSDNFGVPTDVPVNGLVTSPFGWRPDPFRPGMMGFHYGLDLAVPLLTPVRATKAGYVTYAGYDNSYGWRVEITHSGGWLTLYAHNTNLLVKVGQYVEKGAIISLSGSTGASTGPHVHYELHYNGVPLNPALYIKVPLRYD